MYKDTGEYLAFMAGVKKVIDDKANKLNQEFDREFAKLMAIPDERKTDKSIKFKIGSYKKAAKAIRDLSEPVEAVDASRLAVLKAEGKMGGVGDAIFKKIQEICTSGKIKQMEKIQKNAPPVTVTEFLKIRGVGPEGARKIWETHGVATFGELVKDLESGKIKVM